MSRYIPTERVGINAVERVVLKEFKWIFREQPISDVGIDAHIEPVIAGTPNGKLLGVQIKSGPSHFTIKDDHLIYYGSLVHLKYWLEHSLPVILIGHLPESDASYWVQINSESVKMTKAAWKVEIPKSNKLEKSASKDLLSLLEGTETEIKNRNLFLHADTMKFLDGGGKLVIEKMEWHNKSLSRGEVELIKINRDGVEETIEAGNFWYTGYETKSLVETVYPWASVSIDNDFYDKNFDSSFYDVYTDAYIENNEFYPYKTIASEVSLFRFQIELNELGESFLRVLFYLEA